MTAWTRAARAAVDRFLSHSASRLCCTPAGIPTAPSNPTSSSWAQPGTTVLRLTFSVGAVLRWGWMVLRLGPHERVPG